MSNIKQIVITFETTLVTDDVEYFEKNKDDLYNDIMCCLQDKIMHYALIDSAELTIKNKGDICL